MRTLIPFLSLFVMVISCKKQPSANFEDLEVNNSALTNRSIEVKDAELFYTQLESKNQKRREFKDAIIDIFWNEAKKIKYNDVEMIEVPYFGMHTVLYPEKDSEKFTSSSEISFKLYFLREKKGEISVKLMSISPSNDYVKKRSDLNFKKLRFSELPLDFDGIITTYSIFGKIQTLLIFSNGKPVDYKYVSDQKNNSTNRGFQTDGQNQVNSTCPLVMKSMYRCPFGYYPEGHPILYTIDCHVPVWAGEFLISYCSFPQYYDWVCYFAGLCQAPQDPGGIGSYVPVFTLSINQPELTNQCLIDVYNNNVNLNNRFLSYITNLRNSITQDPLDGFYNFKVIETFNFNWFYGWPPVPLLMQPRWGSENNVTEVLISIDLADYSYSNSVSKQYLASNIIGGVNQYYVSTYRVGQPYSGPNLSLLYNHAIENIDFYTLTIINRHKDELKSLFNISETHALALAIENFDYIIRETFCKNYYWTGDPWTGYSIVSGYVNVSQVESYLNTKCINLFNLSLVDAKQIALQYQNGNSGQICN